MTPSEVQISFYRYVASNNPIKVDALLSEYGYKQKKPTLISRIDGLKKVIKANKDNIDFVNDIITIHPDKNVFDVYYNSISENTKKDKFLNADANSGIVTTISESEKYEKQQKDILNKNLLIGATIGVGSIFVVIALIKILK